MRRLLVLVLAGPTGLGCMSTAGRTEPAAEIRPLATPSAAKVTAEGIDEHNARRIARDLHDELDREALKKPH